jgi:hypothetical protein
VAGVKEALETHLDPNAGLALCGHSFWSCQLTWLLKSSLRSRIRQIVLVDPVTINLSESDVMVNLFVLASYGTARRGGIRPCAL